MPGALIAPGVRPSTAMKPYGHKRRDALTCVYGCCGYGKGNVENRKPSNKRRVDKAASKRARQAGKAEARPPAPGETP
jgi:hypothetical protein